MMQRRVGQHDSQFAQTWSHTLGQLWRFAEASQYDGRRPAAQQRALPRVQMAEPLRSIQISHHHGKGLLATPLTQSERVDRSGILCIARELKSTDTFKGHDVAMRQSLNRRS